MGCGSSVNTVVRPVAPGELRGDEDETGSKHSCRGDSAVSKSTTDSGVVMENRDVPALPGVVPRKLPPLTSPHVSPPLLRRHSAAQDRQKSSEILEELLNQGIIPMGPSRENSSGAGEAYSIMLNEKEISLRRPPARLESLKSSKPQISKEEIDEKIRLAEERRKLKQDEMTSRLRAKSARVRVPARSLSTGEDEDTSAVIDEDHIDQTNSPPQERETMKESAADGRQSKNAQLNQEDTKKEKENVDKNHDLVTVTQGDLSDSGSHISFQHTAASDNEIF